MEAVSTVPEPRQGRQESSVAAKLLPPLAGLGATGGTTSRGLRHRATPCRPCGA